MKYEFLETKLASGELSHLDAYFAEFMADLTGTTSTDLIGTFALLSQAQSKQHNCLDLSGAPEIRDQLLSLDCVTDRSTQANPATPLVLSENKLFLHRFDQYEANIARDLIKRNTTIEAPEHYRDILDELFPPVSEPDWQKVAAYHSLTRQLSIITGGPGTGKTSTVVKILVALARSHPEIIVKLAAPTGKAAARLTGSIKKSLSDLPESLRHSVPTEVSTIHRLLGLRRDGHSYRYNQFSPITTDLLILDEVSMIDIVMFDRITKALPDSARLILLGDPEQLPSVENGAVLTDLCSLDPGYDQVFSGLIERNLSIECPIVEGKPHKLTNSFCRLYKNYRFSDDKGIGALASAIRHRKPIDFSDNDEVSFISEFTVDSLIGDIMRHYQNYLELTKTEADAELLLEAFDQHRILTPVREGQFGVSALNEAISGILHSDTEADTHYHGKPVMITKNDYNLRLFNGDIGICVKNSKGDMEVAFKGEDGEILYYLVSRLPAFETCFVMTVHKAQGSEFDQVSLVLPENEKITDDLITHELIYTGITRTRSHITIYARPDYLSACLDNYSSRLSCLTNRFTELPDNDKDQRLEQMDLF